MTTIYENWTKLNGFSCSSEIDDTLRSEIVSVLKEEAWDKVKGQSNDEYEFDVNEEELTDEDGRQFVKFSYSLKRL